MAYQITEKKKAFFAYKEELLRDIKYFEQRIEEARSLKTNSSYFDDDDDDSDSDNNFSLDMGPSVTDLKLEQGCLQTCLHATQELTNLCVLQSEVNVMVNDPEYERERPVTEPGTWREVTADCRVDLVPFSITFYVHQSSLPFGPTSYRGLRVLPVKAAHENELAKSILPRVDTPSNAVEVLRSYAVAHRSRRTTLARVAEKYSNSLFMEPMTDGGYLIKCANLLEVIWTLENNRSPVAPFHHRMKFDLEYMDEMYVKIISQAHRELSDPTLETDERTRLLSKIIATCLEAQGPTQELYESMESDVESENLRKRRTTLDEEMNEPANKKKKDSEIMAPPKTLPKKTKPKGKENNADNKITKSVKRSVTDNRDDGAKKTKLSNDKLVTNSNVSTTTKVDNENVAVKKKSDNKTSNVKDNNAIKMNGEKEVTKGISTDKKNIAKTKKSNKNDDIVTKNAGNENVNVLKKGSDSKASDAKNNAGSSKLDKVKKTNENIKTNTDKIINATESAVSKKVGNKQNSKVNEKNIAATHNSDKLDNNKKNKKIVDGIQNQDIARNSNKVNNNKNTNSNKPSKNVEETNSERQNVQSNSANNEKAHVTKVSSSHANIVSKNDNLSTIAKVSNKKNNPKTKSTENMKENLANVGNDFNVDINTNKKSKSKSMEKAKTVNPVLNKENLITKDKHINTKNVNNYEESNVKSNVEEKKLKSKSKEKLSNDALKSKTSLKSSNPENMGQDDLPKHSKKPVSEKGNTKHVTKDNPTLSATNREIIKANHNTEKTVDKRDSAQTKIRDVNTGVKLSKTVKNMNGKSKNTDKMLERNDNSNKKDKNSVDLNKLPATKVDRVNKELPVEVNDKNVVGTNDKVSRNFVKQKNSNNDQILVANYNANDNLLKPKVNMKINQILTKNNTNKNLRPSKSPIQKSKIKLLNPRNKISIDKLKVINKNKGNVLQKGTHDENKISTKIPQKLMSVREQIVKKNPLRISPRKPHTNLNMKVDSQNSSRSSQRSLQKPMTGIPRLMKKPIHKG